MKDFKLFGHAYDLCAGQPDKYVSAYFIKYINKAVPLEFPENPLRTAMVTGYYLRCAKTVLNQKLAKDPDQKIKNILSLKSDKEKRIEEVANYLDKHGKLGLSEKIADYSLIPFDDTQEIFTLYVNTLIDKVLKERKVNDFESLRELICRNMAFGYLYKLSEEFAEKIKK